MKILARVIILFSLLFLTGCIHPHHGRHGVSADDFIPDFFFPTHHYDRDVYVDHRGGHKQHGYKSGKKHHHKKHHNKHDYYDKHDKHQRHGRY